MKHYLDIERCKQKYAETFQNGEHIIIQTKIDGSNASIAYDEKNDCLAAFSRRQHLNEQNTLNGFWNWVQTLNVEYFKKILGARYIIFGEWLTPHSVKYPENILKKFYMFDVWDKETEQYLTQRESIAIYNALHEYLPNYVHTLYDGPFVSWGHTLNFLKENTYGESPCMEGIVIKRQDHLDSKSSNLPYYVKIVAEKFSEVHGSKKQKTIDPEALAKKEAEKELISTIVTPQRVQKLLFKFIEDGVIPQDWDEHNMKDISKIIPRAVYNDCIKEENEIVIQCENFGKISASLAMSHVRNLLNYR